MIGLNQGRAARMAGLAALMAFTVAGRAHAITVAINPVTVQSNCAINVNGVVSFTRQLPATAVTIDFLPPNGGQPVRLVTNQPLQAGGAFAWSGAAPGFASIPAGSQVKVWSNRQVSSTASVPTCTPAQQWQTINFSGLVSGGSVNSYSQDGFNLAGVNIYAASTGLTPAAMGAFPSFTSTVFTLTKTSGGSFSVKSMMLRNLNGQVPAQNVTFTGTTQSGGKVTYAITTPASSVTFQTYQFPANFTGLKSVVWTPQLTVVTNPVVQ